MWDILAIEPTSDVKAIKRAYASKLKEIDQNLQSDKFMALREAYNRALDWSVYADYEYDYDEEDDEEDDENDDECIEDSAVDENERTFNQNEHEQHLVEDCSSDCHDEKDYYWTLGDHLSDFKFRMNVNAWMDYYMNRDVFDSYLIATDMEILLEFIQDDPVLSKSVWQFVHHKILEFKNHSLVYSANHLSQLNLAMSKTRSRLAYSFIDELDLDMDEDQLTYYETVFTKINQVVVEIDKRLYKNAAKNIQELETVDGYKHKNLELLKLYLKSKHLSKENFEKEAIDLINKYNGENLVKLNVFDMGLDCKAYRLCRRVMGKFNKRQNTHLSLILNMRILIRRPSLLEAIDVCRKFKKADGFTDLEVENMKKLSMEFLDYYSLNEDRVQDYFIVRAIVPHGKYLSDLNMTEITQSAPLSKTLKLGFISLLKSSYKTLIFLVFAALSFSNPFFIFVLIFMIVELFKKSE